MRYHNITHDDMRNGDGLRVVLWVSGCAHHCPGCQNPITWDPNDGLLFDEKAVRELCDQLEQDYISGLTLSGGDPFYPSNRKDLADLLFYLSQKFPGKKTWCYTGYRYEEIKDEKLMEFIDVLVDGRFEKDLADVNYPWAGSTNQRVIDIQKSRERGRVVLYDSEGRIQRAVRYDTEAACAAELLQVRTCEG